MQTPRVPLVPFRNRSLTAGVAVVVLGAAIVLLTWIRARDQRQMELTNLLGSLADETLHSIERHLEQKVRALQNQASFWQIQGLASEAVWQADTKLLMSYYPGIQWVAWVSRDSTRTRIAYSEDTHPPDHHAVAVARRQVGSPETSVQGKWTDAYRILVRVPVRIPTDSLGLLLAEIQVDSSWFANSIRMTRELTVAMISDQGDTLVLQQAGAAGPEWMRVRRSLTTPTGTQFRMEFTPSPAFVRQTALPWPDYFLLTGLVLAVALAVLVFLFLRMRDFSAALKRINRDLDERLAELREINEELDARVQARTADLTQALREVEALSHSVSHDLRSPIGAILNFTAVLEEDFGPQLDDEGRALLGRIRAAAERSTRLLNALSEFAAEDNGRPEIVDMKEVVAGAFAEARAHEGGTGEVRFHLADLPPAWCNTAAAHRIAVNLIGNALKYTRGRERREVHVEGTANGAECTYAIRDNGPGFEPTRAKEIFEPFRRLSAAEYEGTGLGLAIVAKIVRRLGGRVWAESDGMTGATFYFTLPCPEGTRA